MKRYIALFRGINISGKNKIPMAELKDCFVQLSYTDVRTHLNSGNIVFSAHDTDARELGTAIRGKIAERFDLDIPVLVLPQDALRELLPKAPDWWDAADKAIYDNLIFVLPPATAKTIAEKIGEATPELEKVQIEGEYIFWSFDRARYGKANWWKKTAAPGIGEHLTIRTAGTVKKLIGL